jgi:hypothetical protein
MSNVFTFPVAGSRRAPEAEPPELEPRADGRRRSSRSMHTFVFRSYDLIVQSTEAELQRDVGFDPHKAQVKLTHIRRQIAADREQAAAREKLLTLAESRLSAAIAAARPVSIAGKASAPAALPTPARPMLTVQAVLDSLSQDELLAVQRLWRALDIDRPRPQG